MSDETRQRILEIAADHEFVPSTVARELKGARVGTIGFAVNRRADTLGAAAFFTDLIAGVQSSTELTSNQLTRRLPDNAPDRNESQLIQEVTFRQVVEPPVRDPGEP